MAAVLNVKNDNLLGANGSLNCGFAGNLSFVGDAKFLHGTPYEEVSLVPTIRCKEAV